MRIIRPVKVKSVGTFSRASVAKYWDKNGLLQTAAVNELRVTYDPSDLTKAPYVMIEPAATNYLTYSSTISNAAWLKSNLAGVSSGGLAGPGGTSSAFLVTEDSSNGIHELRLPAVTLTAGSTYTVSIFAKAGTRNYLRLGFSSVWGATAYAVFDLNSGTVVYTNDNVTYSIKSCGNGWYRCSTTYTALATATGTCYAGFQTLPVQGSGYQADGTGNMYLTMAQFETGSVATSYIDTAGSTGSRSAESTSGTGLLYSNVPENDYPAWSSTKLYTTGDYILDSASHKVYQSIIGVSGTATFTAASVGNVIMKKADGSVYVPAVGTPVSFTGTPPTGITSGTTYYVQATASGAFSISATAGGAAISTGAQAAPMSTVASTNVNVAAPNVTYWLDAGYDNRWEMFDDSVTSQTSQTGDVTVVFAPGARLDAIAGLNMAANSMKVSFTDLSTGTVVYSAKANLISNSGIQDLYDYLYEPVVQMPDCLIDSIPLGLSTSAAITVTFQSNGTTKVGGLIFGLSKDIGVTEWGSKVGIVDYSVKTKDSFGNYNITPRTFSKKGDFTVQVPTGQVDALQNTLAQYRSTPIVYIGSNADKKMTQFNSTIIYGFYKDFDINIAYNAYSVCSISIEGLT